MAKEYSSNPLYISHVDVTMKIPILLPLGTYNREEKQMTSWNQDYI